MPTYSSVPEVVMLRRNSDDSEIWEDKGLLDGDEDDDFPAQASPRSSSVALREYYSKWIKAVLMFCVVFPTGYFLGRASEHCPYPLDSQYTGPGVYLAFTD